MLWKKTTIWIVAFAVMTIIAVAVNVVPKSGPAVTLELPVVNKDDVTGFEISKGGDLLSLNKSGDQWMMKPSGLRASPRKVERLLDSLAAFTVGSMISKKAGMHDQYDVGSAGTILSVTMKDGLKWSMIIGKDTADNTGNYVRLPDDDRVYISFRSLGKMLRTDDKYWRDRRMIYFEKEEPTFLKLEGPKGTFNFVRDDAGQWGFENVPENLPAGYRLDPGRVQRVIDALSNMTSVAFGASDLPKDASGLDAPAIKATVKLPGDKSVELVVGKKTGRNFYAHVAGDSSTYEITEYNFKNLNKGVEDFRNLFVSQFDLGKARKMEVRDFADSASVTLVNEDGWKIESANPEPDQSFVLDPVKVEKVVQGASEFEARAYVGKGAPANAGLAKPNGVLTVTLDDGSTHSIKFGNDAEEKDIYVQGDMGYVYMARKVTRDMLIKGLDDLKVSAKQATIPTFSAEQLQGLPPDVREQLLERQRSKIMQSQMLKQIIKKQKKLKN